MKNKMVNTVIKNGLVVCLSLSLYECGTTQIPTEAKQSDIVISGSNPGITPFVCSVRLDGRSIAQLASVEFRISPRPNSVSKAVNVTWKRNALIANGYLQDSAIELPVFGLYADYENQIALQLTFTDGSTSQLQTVIRTQPYTDPTGVYSNPTILKPRMPGTALGFDFFIMKSLVSPPVIVDTDAQIRWAVPGLPTQAVYYGNGAFIRGNDHSLDVTQLRLDGNETTLQTNLPYALLSEFNHNIDPGPHGLLSEFNGTDDLGQSIEDMVVEITPFSSVPPTQIFDLADILTSYMVKNGDDPTLFVRSGSDWFHVNATVYDPRDNTIIISSRENFLIKLNYATHDIVWMFGDPTKYWYTFPSLRAKALTLDTGGLYPVGQHGVSITSDGYVMIFNEGFGSLNQPSGTSAGITRTYSAVSAYSINTTTMTAHEVWDFDYRQTIFSAICGSSYEAPGKTYLVDFAAAANRTQARLVGLDRNHNVAFDFQYAQPTQCGAAWNAIPIQLDTLQIN